MGIFLALAIQPSAVKIERPQALEPFFLKLRALSRGEDSRVSVVHIGDSHIQAGFFTGEIRRILQARFGDAGRGLVFPWEVGGTNSPKDFHSASNAVWKARRVTMVENEIPSGISGWGLLGPEGPFVLKLQVRAGSGQSSTFDRVRLFAEQGPGWAELEAAGHKDAMILEKAAPGYVDFLHTVQAGDTLYGVAKSWEVSLEELKKANSLDQDKIFPGQTLMIKKKNTRPVKVNRDSFEPLSPFRPPREGGPVLEARLPASADHVFILPKRQGLPDDRTLLYGASLEKSGARGVLYHALGANGAEFRHFLKAPTFIVQVPELSPDLVVVTLGTNENLRPRFDVDVFRQQILSFLESLRESIPEAPILLMSPPDSLPKGEGKRQAGTASKVISACAQERGLAFWDFHAAMGGEGSMDLWMGSGLARDDGVHLTEAGYLQAAGEFSAALMGAYENP